MSRIEVLTRVLQSLRNSAADIDGAALISNEGLTIASELPSHMDEMRVGGMSATLSSLGMRAATELQRGTVEEVLVRGTQGYVVMMDTGVDALLLCTTNERARLGLVFLEMRRAIREFQGLLG